MYKFIFTVKAKKQLEKLSTSHKNKVLNKLLFFKKSKNIYDYLKIIHNLLPSTHRIRISNFRLLVIVKDYEIIIVKVWHRKEIYK